MCVCGCVVCVCLMRAVCGCLRLMDENRKKNRLKTRRRQIKTDVNFMKGAAVRDARGSGLRILKNANRAAV